MMSKTYIKINDDLKKAFKLQAVNENKTMSSIMESLIKGYLAKNQPDDMAVAEPVESKYLTSKQIADLFSVHDETIRRRMRNGEMQGSFRVGQSWYISKADLNRFIEQKKHGKVVMA